MTVGTDDLAQELAVARRHTDALFHVIAPEWLYERPVSQRHRLIFYLGHLEAFDWNTAIRYGLSMPSFHPTFDELFAFGIDPGADNLPTDTEADWPSLEEVDSYRSRVRQRVDAHWNEVPPQLRHIAVEHRLMHAETLCYLLHSLPFEAKREPPTEATPVCSPVSENPYCAIPGGTATLGQARGADFGWDNEFDQFVLQVPDFAIQKYKVTNREYLEFVNQGAPAPHFWKHHESKWCYRGMFEDVPLPPHAPVYVTHAEASAYAAWRGATLPSEAQYHRAAYGDRAGQAERAFPWGDNPAPGLCQGNFDFRHWDPIPVNATPAGDGAWGIAQMVGNGWEWTCDLFEPFPGFQRFEAYPGYSEPFFDGQHYVLKGGSPRTAAKLLRRSFRNWFRPDYPYVYATFRCVEGG